MKPTDPIPEAVSIIATVISFVSLSSPLPVILDIYRKKQVGTYPAAPYVVGILLGGINGAYSMYSHQTVSFISCMLCGTMHAVYMGFYVYYSRNKWELLTGLAAILCVAAIIDAIGPVAWILVKGSHRSQFIDIWLGVCACVSVTLIYSGQLTTMESVIKKKDASSMSGTIACSGLINSILWTLYASLIRDPFFLVANGIGVVASVLQAFLILKYRKPPLKPRHDELEIGVKNPYFQGKSR